MTPRLDPATVTTRTDADTQVVDWASALAAAGIDHEVEGEVQWHREPQRLSGRDREPDTGRDAVAGAVRDSDADTERDAVAGAVSDSTLRTIDVYGGILEDDPLVLVLVLLARDGSGTVTAAMLCGRPVAHAEGPIVGPHGVCTPEAVERVVTTFERAVVADADDEQGNGRTKEGDHDVDTGEHPSAAPSG